MSEIRFDGRVAVVTGAGAGLGREYALLFAARGAKVVVNDLGGSFHGEGNSQQAADVVVNEIKAKGGIAVANYNSVTDGEKIIQTAMENFGRVDILINNAGILRDRSFARISEQDWDLIHNVHLKGSFKTTQAAWPIFRKQNYGRIIMTSSNSGVYGNFGQANYSAAKLGLAGLTNTLAIEGEKYNIHCNTIIPTAASRMTKDILPEILYNELRPKLIAPVVAYLCHESNNDSGAMIESAAGWATKVHMVRGQGTVLRTSLSEDVTPEFVRDVWHKVTDMSDAKRVDAIGQASGRLLNMLDELKDAQVAKAKGEFINTFSYNSKDLILYALGIGASVTNKMDLKFLYENHSEFSPLPTFFVLPGILLNMTSGLVTTAITHTTVNLTQILHGEQYIEICNDLPLDGKLKTVGSVLDVMDKKSGAIVVTSSDTFDDNGQLLIRNQSATFVVGVGNFGGKKEPSKDVIPTVPAPKRNPDATVLYKTSADQAALYRLSGDLNPLHIDPDFSIIAGYKVPILHGLCTLGFSARAVIQTYANNDSSLFKAIKVRFTSTVIPGDTLKIAMWQNGNRIHFETSVVETGKIVISGSYVDLKNVIKSNLTSASDGPLQSDAIFANIKERINENPDRAKNINGIFLYKITSGGRVAKQWTLDLKSAKIYEGEPTTGTKVDTTLTIADSDMTQIALGQMNAQEAFMKGKLKISGNIMLTQKLVPLLKSEAKL